MLQLCAVRWSVLQCVLQCVLVMKNYLPDGLPVRVLQCVAVCCSMLQCVAVCCSVLQRVAECCRAAQCVVVCVAVCASDKEFIWS